MTTSSESYLLKRGLILPMDEARSNPYCGDVLIENGIISCIRASIDADSLPPNCRTIDCSNSVVMPGFINAHNHSPMSLFRGLADDYCLHEWLHDHVWPLEKHLEGPQVVAPATLASIEMLKGGITTNVDMYFHTPQILEAYRKTGQRGFFGVVAADLASHGHGTMQRVTEELHTLTEECSRGPKKLLLLHQPSVSVHAIYSCEEATLKAVAQLAKEQDCLLQIHLSETRQEVEDCKRLHGMSPIKYLASIGFLGPRVLAAHVTHLEPGDEEVLARTGTKVVHCPVSNAKLGGGVMEMKRLVDAGVVVCLGTDSPCSNNRLDMFQEMKTASLLQSAITGDPRFPSSRQVVEMATLQAAIALGISDRVGSVEPGKEADLIVVDMMKPHLIPLVENVFSHLVYSATQSDVTHVFCQGKCMNDVVDYSSPVFAEAYDDVHETLRVLHLKRKGAMIEMPPYSELPR